MFFGTVALFALALVLGGLGPHAPLFSGLIESTAFPLLVGVTLFGRTESAQRIECIAPILFLVLMLAIGLGQLMPLDPATWQALPGREVPPIIFEAIGVPVGPRPLSLAPEDTRLAIQSWLPPFAIFIATMLAIGRERFWLAHLVIAAAALSALVGLLQLSFGDGTLYLDPGAFLGRYPGLFANYNQQAVFLTCAVALLPAVVAGQGKTTGTLSWWPSAFWALALVGMLATQSRAGLLLFGLSSLVAAMRLWTRRRATRTGPTGRRPIVFIVGVVVVVAIGGWLGSGGYRAELMSSRFAEVGADLRYGFWASTIEAIRANFPYGSGFGSFEPVYQLTESLEQVQEFVVNHAHQDYLELILEAGAAGILLLALFVFWFGERLISLARRPDDGDPLAWSGAMIVGIVMLHSLVEYPLRTQSIACTFAFACALLIAPPGAVSSRVRLGSRGSGRIET